MTIGTEEDVEKRRPKTLCDLLAAEGDARNGKTVVFHNCSSQTIDMVKRGLFDKGYSLVPHVSEDVREEGIEMTLVRKNDGRKEDGSLIEEPTGFTAEEARRIADEANGFDGYMRGVHSLIKEDAEDGARSRWFRYSSTKLTFANKVRKALEEEGYDVDVKWSDNLLSLALHVFW